MNLSLSDEAQAFGEAARRAFEAAGGDDDAVATALADLGAWDLDPRGNAVEAEAAAALCRAAGWWAVPVPVADRLADASTPMGLVLSSWTLLGLMDRAMADAVAYVKDRHQFGQPLSSFQGVQFPLTDAEVERVGVEELAKFALWSGTVVDALALRLAAVEGAEVVFRITHQVHGAIGFCDETQLSWLSRASQRLRREPLTPSATRAALTQEIGAHGFSGLFA
jgi:hypothetical protein